MRMTTATWAMTAIVLLAFAHSSCALKCYVNSLLPTTDNDKITEKVCEKGEDLCGKMTNGAVIARSCIASTSTTNAKLVR